MSNFNFDSLFEDLKSGVESTAKEALHGYLEQARSDGHQLLNALKDDLQRWAIELEEGQITMNDLTFLISEQKELNQMAALKQAGIAEVQIDKFKNGLINMILGTVLNFVKV